MSKPAVAPDLKKSTTAEVALVPHLDLDGRMATVVLVKQQFEVDRTGKVQRTPGAEIRFTDVPWDEDAPETSSTKYPSDVCLRKPSTDVILAGAAVRAYREPARAIDVLVRVGPVEQVLRVHGPRVWFRGATGLALSPAEPVEEVALRWEFAFGGADFEDELKPLEEARNPVGRGIARDPATLVHEPGPQIEDPRHPIVGLRGAVPAGVGALGRHWEPRRRYVGTYDEAWKRERMPLPPLDFDTRFNQAAPPALITPEPLTGGELVQVHNCCELGPLQFPLPRIAFFVGARTDVGLTEHRPQLDTVLLEPNRRTLDLTWRSVVPMPRRASKLHYVQVHEKARV